jgi:cytochrome c oxidase cbb3-type subunit III
MAGLMGCHMPGKPEPGLEVPRPEAVLGFDQLYGANCAGCHGKDGTHGAATNLANPVYQAWVDDATLTDWIAKGRKGTLMPGFGAASGGSLTDPQVAVIVHGMRERWGKGDVLAGLNAPAYKAAVPANVANGAAIYTAACARCHEGNGRQPAAAGSILNGAFLGLIDEQMVRTTIVAGRPDIGQPDWRGLIPGRAMTDAEVTDVAAWLVAQKPVSPGQPYPQAQGAKTQP